MIKTTVAIFDNHDMIVDTPTIKTFVAGFIKQSSYEEVETSPICMYLDKKGDVLIFKNAYGPLGTIKNDT